MIKAEEMEKLPEGWKRVRLREIVEISDNRRVPLDSEYRATIKGDFPYCGATGIIDYINDYIFDGEYLLIAEDGGNFDRFEETAYIMRGKFWVNNHVHILKGKNGILDNSFLMYFVNFQDVSRYISGSTREKLNQRLLKSVVIHLPPLPEQQKIAEILETVDNAIENTDAIIEKYKRIKQGLMQDLLTRGIVMNYELGIMNYGSELRKHESGIMNDELGVGSHESEIGNWELRDERKHKLKDSLLGKIPEEWEVVSLGDIGKIITGSTPPTLNSEYYGDHYLFISPEDITDSRFIGDSQKKLSESGFKISRPIPPNSICTVCIGSTIGKVGMTTSICTTNQQINSIVPDTDICNPDALFYLVLFYSQTPLKQEAGLQAVPIVNKSRFSRIQIPLPPLPEQRRIASILSQVDEVIEKEQKYKEKLERIKRGLMRDLLTGRIRVGLEL